jgi:hypothetical protein
MNISIITQLLLIIAILSTGVVYGTDVFYAIAGKKAAQQSKDSSIADLNGHTHLIADKRMPVVGISSIFSTAIFIILNGWPHISAIMATCALLCLLIHLALYITIAKPINSKMSAAAIKGIVLPNIRQLQQKWDAIIYYRSILLITAMIMLVLAGLNYNR